MSIRTLIVDDEPLACERIRMLLAPEPDVEILAECRNGTDALRAIAQLAPDLVFLDVQMPELTGFEVLDRLEPARMPVIVFVTAYDQYALKAFEFSALDYLLKPFDRERFTRALSRARAELDRRKAGEVNEQVLKLLTELQHKKKHLERLIVRSGGKVVFLRADEIDWIEAAGNYVRLHSARDEYLYRETMTKLESHLDPDRFARIHRSTIVNVERIKELQPWFRGDYQIVLKDNQKLTLSRSYRGRLNL
ncbi:MAG TPA: LytTR family DNA-binding domain-containing protein [Bryobacteraceae bacterium]|nr:LytTR family DNA-binding domain-containing protein [Bryobacteraceae bacterium]